MGLLVSRAPYLVGLPTSRVLKQREGVGRNEWKGQVTVILCVHVCERDRQTNRWVERGKGKGGIRSLNGIFMPGSASVITLIKFGNHFYLHLCSMFCQKNVFIWRRYSEYREWDLFTNLLFCTELLLSDLKMSSALAGTSFRSVCYYGILYASNRVQKITPCSVSQQGGYVISYSPCILWDIKSQEISK